MTKVSEAGNLLILLDSLVIKLETFVTFPQTCCKLFSVTIIGKWKWIDESYKDDNRMITGLTLMLMP